MGAGGGILDTNSGTATLSGAISGDSERASTTAKWRAFEVSKFSSCIVYGIAINRSVVVRHVDIASRHVGGDPQGAVPPGISVPTSVSLPLLALML